MVERYQRNLDTAILNRRGWGHPRYSGAAMNEAETRTEYIDPALGGVKFQIFLVTLVCVKGCAPSSARVSLEKTLP